MRALLEIDFLIKVVATSSKLHHLYCLAYRSLNDLKRAREQTQWHQESVCILFFLQFVSKFSSSMSHRARLGLLPGKQGSQISVLTNSFAITNLPANKFYHYDGEPPVMMIVSMMWTLSKLFFICSWWGVHLFIPDFFAHCISLPLWPLTSHFNQSFLVSIAFPSGIGVCRYMISWWFRIPEFSRLVLLMTAKGICSHLSLWIFRIMAVNLTFGWAMFHLKNRQIHWQSQSE